MERGEKQKRWAVSRYGIGKVEKVDKKLGRDHLDALDYLYETGWGNTSNYHPEAAGTEYNKDGSVKAFNSSAAYRHEAVFQELVNMGLAKAKGDVTKIIQWGSRKELGRKALAEYHLTREGEKFARELKENKKRNLGFMLSHSMPAFIFLLSGLFFMTLPDFGVTATGNVIGTTIPTDTIVFFSSFALMIIGGILLFMSFKK